MTPLRLGAVSYLNTKPLVYGLDAMSDQFELRYDVPAVCAALLHEGRVDLGLVPAIEYIRGPQDYWIVPDVAIASDGEVASVAVFSKVPIGEVRSLALDVSSRTSAALTRILCAKRWGIAPAFMPAAPDLDAMLATADAALVIGDPALEIDAAGRGLSKYDLGGEWRALTGLPFVYAMWTGREGAASPAQCAALLAARTAGEAHLPEIARGVAGGDAAHEARSLAYLRDNLKYGLGDREAAGLRRFLELGVEVGVAVALKPLRFYQ
ncbi:MAG: menaquinone biosynthesis protein [Acidobacteriota bacterium]|nr:menaquinone biosynthesis protein [Acidobacteriota bacterium]MDP3718139.1 menaquinone biosynthesis protein [Acidobacteriota bacterium]